MKQYIIILIVWNIFVCAIYGIDKRRSYLRKRRIKERTLLLCTFFMGSVGAFFGMSLFRHKTRHMKFWVVVILSFLVNITAFLLIRKHIV